MPIGIPMGAMCVQRFDDSRKFCNSHYLSHFAAFFIDARTKRSVVESFVFDCTYHKRVFRRHWFRVQDFGSWAIGGRAPGATGPPAVETSWSATGPPKQRQGTVDTGWGGRASRRSTLTR